MDHGDAIPTEEALPEHTAFLTRLARGLLRDEHAAEDVVQDAFVRAMERPPRPGNLSGWLARVTKNLALSRLRSESRRRRREDAVKRDEGLPSAEEAVARIELCRRAVGAVLDLPEPYRSTLVHRYFSDLSVDEIARRGERSRETVRTRLRRGLGMVRDRLDADAGGDRSKWSVLLLPLLSTRSGAAGLATGGVLIVTTKLKAFAVLAVLIAALAGFGLYRSLSSPDGRATPPAAPRPVRTANGPEGAGSAPESGVPAPVDFTRVDRDRDVFGVVVDESGTPVAGAGVESFRRPFRRYASLIPDSLETVPGPRATTAADGSFSLRFERGQTADVVVRADGYAPLVRHACPAGGRLRLILVKGRPLSIRIQTGDGEPVAGAHVVFLKALFGVWSGEAETGAFLPSAGITDSEGILTLGSAPPDPKLSVVAWQESHGAVLVDSLEIPPEGPAVVVLPGGEDVSGVVVDAETGEPVAGATLAFLPVPVGPRVTTERDGRFVWPAWNAGLQRQGTMFVTADGYALTPVRMGEKIEISHGGGVEGRVVSGKGVPVAGAHVTAIGQPHGMPDLAEQVTGETGEFALRGLDPAYGHALILAKPGSGRTVFDLDPIPLGSMKRLGDIVLSRGRRIEGRVLDAAGAPVPEAQVTLTGSNADREKFTTGDGKPGRARGERESGRTDDLGRFRFRDLAPGRYELSARVPGRSPLTKAATLSPGADRLDVELRPESGVTFTVRVVDDHSAPVAGATVGLYWQTSPQPGRRTEKTDAGGRAGFAVPAGIAEVYVSVKPPDDPPMLSATTRARPDLGELQIELAHAAPVAGTVLGPDGKPLARASVSARWSGKIGAMVATDTDGSFSLLVPLDARVDLALTGQVGKRVELLDGSATGVAAGTKDVVIRAERIATDRTLRVQVLTPDGEPVAALALNLPGPDHRWLRTGDDGCATARDLQARKTSVAVLRGYDHPAFTRWAAPEPVEVVPNGQEVVLRFREGRPISGKVLDPEGNPGHALVTAWDRERKSHFEAPTSNETGEFRVLVPADSAGPFTLEIQAAARPGKPGRPIVKEFKDTRVRDVALGTTDLRIILERR